MARNSEKANAMLNKWLRIKSGLEQERVLTRPKNPSEVSNVKEAEKWRNHVIKEIMYNISKIEDASLGEFVIRDLNDEINRLIRVRRRWDDRIVELGGTDYRRLSSNLENSYGSELRLLNSNYKYFGAARNLPGIRELFQRQQRELETTLSEQSRAQLHRLIDHSYYGFGDERLYPDLLLAELEHESSLNSS